MGAFRIMGIFVERLGKQSWTFAIVLAGGDFIWAGSADLLFCRFLEARVAACAAGSAIDEIKWCEDHRDPSPRGAPR